MCKRRDFLFYLIKERYLGSGIIGGVKTLLSWYKLYGTNELFERVEEQYQTVEGFKQTVERFEKYPAQNNASK